MELRHLRYFIAVAEELHFARAAERLHISPPSLTQQIQSLERDLGARLLRRTKRKVELTDAGMLFLDEARITMRQAERTEQIGRRAGRGEVGAIEVGYVSTAACSGILSQTVSAYRRTHPMVAIRLHRMVAIRLLEGLAGGTLDVCFMRQTAKYPPGVAGVVIGRQAMIVALPHDHPLAARRVVQAAALAHEPFIAPSFETEQGLAQHTLAVGEEGGFVPRIVERAADFVTIVTLVSAGFGLAIVPQSLSCIQLPGVVYRPLEQTKRPVNLVAAFRRDERGPATKAFISQIREQAKDLITLQA